MTLSSGTFDPTARTSGAFGHVGRIDLAERRAALLRRRRSVRRREWFGLLCVAGLALWVASAALMTVIAR